MACGGDKRTKKLLQKAIEKLVKTHGTEPGVLFGFVDEILDDMLPGVHNAYCRADLAEKIRNHLLKYENSHLPKPAVRNWNKYGAIFTILAIFVTVILWILNLVFS